MKTGKVFYIGSATIVVISLIVSYTIPLEETMKAIIASPAILALISILFQLAKDQAKHEKNLILQRENAILGASLASGMGEHIFKQQVTFAEEYMEACYEVISLIYRGGRRTSSDEVESYFRKLMFLRAKYALWLSNETLDKLQPFEDLILDISADLFEIDDYHENHESKMKLNKQIGEKFKKIHGSSPEGDNITKQDIINVLKEILGVNELLSIRTKALQNANFNV